MLCLPSGHSAAMLRCCDACRYGCDSIEVDRDLIDIEPDASAIFIRKLEFKLGACTGPAYSSTFAPSPPPFDNFDCTSPFDKVSAQGVPLKQAQSKTCKFKTNQLSGKHVSMKNLRLDCNAGKTESLIQPAIEKKFWKRNFSFEVCTQGLPANALGAGDSYCEAHCVCNTGTRTRRWQDSTLSGCYVRKASRAHIPQAGLSTICCMWTI